MIVIGGITATCPSGPPQMSPSNSEIRVAQSLMFLVMLCMPLSFFHLTLALSVPSELRLLITIGIFKHIFYDYTKLGA